MEIAAFDIETTGLETQNDRIIELALATEKGTHTWLILHPGLAVPNEIVDLTGITDKMILENGVPFLTAWAEFSLLSCGYENIVGHNAIQFDWPFIRSECVRYGLPKPVGETLLDSGAIYKALCFGQIPREPHIGWAMMVLRMYSSGVKWNLSHAASDMGVDLPNNGLHRAGPDAEVTLALIEALLEEIEEHA